MNLQEELKALKDRIAELEEQARKEKEFPQGGDKYWHLGSTGEVINTICGGFDFETDRLDIGNVFKTKDEAEFAVEKLKVESELRKFSRPFETTTDNFFIVYDKYLESLEINCSLKTDIQGVIYFDSREDLRRAVESVDRERVKKYIFGVED